MEVFQILDISILERPLEACAGHGVGSQSQETAKGVVAMQHNFGAHYDLNNNPRSLSLAHRTRKSQTAVKKGSSIYRTKDFLNAPLKTEAPVHVG